MVHQNALAQFLATTLHAQGYAQTLTILTGHDHLQHVGAYGPVTVVDGGTVGAGGLFGIGQQSFGLADLHFAATQPSLLSVDLVRVDPFSGSAQAQRVVVHDCTCVLSNQLANLSSTGHAVIAHVAGP